jgi:hypothetical protein
MFSAQMPSRRGPQPLMGGAAWQTGWVADGPVRTDVTRHTLSGLAPPRPSRSREKRGSTYGPFFGRSAAAVERARVGAAGARGGRRVGEGLGVRIVLTGTLQDLARPSPRALPRTPRALLAEVNIAVRSAEH